MKKITSLTCHHVSANDFDIVVNSLDKSNDHNNSTEGVRIKLWNSLDGSSSSLTRKENNRYQQKKTFSGDFCDIIIDND